MPLLARSLDSPSSQLRWDLPIEPPRPRKARVSHGKHATREILAVLEGSTAPVFGRNFWTEVPHLADVLEQTAGISKEVFFKPLKLTQKVKITGLSQ